jgi:predicted DNA-binding protein YlxM (UPF0122 family)
MFDEKVQKKMILGLLSISRKLKVDTKLQSNAKIKTVIDLIEASLSLFEELGIFYDNASANSPIVKNSMFVAPVYHDSGCVLDGIENHEEVFNKLRKILYKLSHTPEYAELLDDELLLNIHEFLIAIAHKKPFNETNMLLNEIIPEEQRVYTSSGNCFDVLEIFHCYKEKKFINPYDNNPFSPIDICHILNRCIEFNQKHRDEIKELADFLKMFGARAAVVTYKNNIVYLLNDKGKPVGILPQSVLKFNLPMEKDKLILSNRNLLEALYKGIMSMQDISEISVDKLVLINHFKKAMDILNSDYSTKFIVLAKTKSKVDLFEVLNSPLPYGEAIVDSLGTEDSPSIRMK